MKIINCFIQAIVIMFVTQGCQGVSTSPLPNSVSSTIDQLENPPTPTQVMQPIYTCKDLDRDMLSELPPQQRLTRDSLVAWLHEQPGFAEVEPLAQGHIQAVYWTSESRYYGAYFDEQGFIYVVTGWKNEIATISLLLECYGQPEYYSARNLSIIEDTDSTFMLSLWYPRRGLVFFHSSHPLKKPDEVGSGMMIFKANNCGEGLLDETIKKCYVNDIKTESDFEKLRNAIRVWPGSLDKISIDAPNP